MERIDLSTNSAQIKDAYEKVVRGDGATYVVFTATKNGTVEVSKIGSETLEDFVEQFNDGVIQFGLAKVNVPGSDVSKNLLLGWCPDNAPAKARLSYAANFADVSKVLSAYHVQITARDQDDLDVDDFVARVAAAAGARYTAHTSGSNSGPRKPAISGSYSSNKNHTTPQSAKKPALAQKIASASSVTSHKSDTDADDEWGGEKELVERDFERQPLEQVPSAYVPTKVDIKQLRSQKSDTVSSLSSATADAKSNSLPQPDPVAANPASDIGRLTSLPKPKVGGSVASRYKAVTDTNKVSFGAKPVIDVKANKQTPVSGGLSRDFGSTGGKTPAQLWAEKKGYYKDVKGEPDNSREYAKNDARNDEVVGVEGEEEFASVDGKGHVKVVSLVENIGKLSVREHNEEESSGAEQERKSLELKSSPEVTPSPPQKADPVEEESAERLPSAIAEYDYEKDEENEIGFEEQDVIIDIKFVDEEWWSGTNKRTGESGLFPASYVTLEDNSNEGSQSEAKAQSAKAAPVKSVASKSATAEFSYEKDEDNEIAFEEGDLIVDIEFVDDNWWSGKHSSTGEVGLFPSNYVRLNE